MLGATMEDLLVAQQAPQVEDIATCTGGSICPRGPYLPAVVRKYMQTFGAKPAGQKLHVKPRRDLGIAKDPEKLAQQRAARGAAETEADP
jgi:hypothetical protein